MDALVAARLTQLLDGLATASLVAPVSEHRRAAGGELARQGPPEAVGRAGDQDRLLRERSDPASL
jgi:hypothetical protein